MKSLPTRLAMLAVLVLAGCDSNPGAPSAPEKKPGPDVTAAPAGAGSPTAPKGGPRRGRQKAAGAMTHTAD